MIRTDILVLAGASTASLGITIDVLDAANRVASRQLFSWRMLGTNRRTLARGGVAAPTLSFARARPRDLVVVPGLGAATVPEIVRRLAAADARATSRWLARAGAGGCTVASSCTGVFLLGAAGLLDRRDCTTTWWLAGALSSLFPQSRPVVDSMVVEDGGVWTAGAALAHIDLMLALVARLAGAGIADRVARSLIIDRRASQARFIVPAHLAAHDPVVRRIEAVVRGRLKDRLGLPEIARAVAISPRTLGRRLAKATGLTPMRFVQKIRLDAALHLLQTTRSPLARIAEDVGFAEPSALYRLIRRHTGRTPSELRGGAGRVQSGKPLSPRRRAA
ncbi:MAG: helix-turn-helix domain-containing protein [Reyranella sp.]|nr:helix-turn-helix domain-containing protein [Reyranella sp.]